MPNRNASAILELELRRVLIRHLPIGLEGVGVAQTEAVLELLRRKENHRPRQVATDKERDGLRTLRQAAAAHAESVSIDNDGASVCGTCHDPQGQNEAWPCPVWASAELLGLVDPPRAADAI